MAGVVERLGERDAAVLAVLAAVFGGALVYANLAAALKIEVWFGFLVVPAGTIAYSLTFPITDIVDEVYGRRRALYIVWGGLAAEAAMLALALVDRGIPAAPFMEPGDVAAADRVLGFQARIVAASLLAYLVSQHHDVWAFWKWREATGGRWLWLRNNASTAVSQLIDTAIFTTVAFAGTVPWPVLGEMILGQWLAKLLVAALDTPAVYLGVEAIRRLRAEPLVAPEPPLARAR